MEEPTSVIELLSSSQNSRDQGPNEELAARIAGENDHKAVKELVAHLSDKSKAIQNDCIKVIYEIGERNPKLIANYAPDLLPLLKSKNNRLQWGAMTAIFTISSERPEWVYAALPEILAAAELGSVITKDNAVNTLIRLCTYEAYADNCFDLLNEQILKSPVNQLPMYAERAFTVITAANKSIFVKSLNSRLADIEKESKRQRVEAVLRKIQKHFPDS
ncbi:HEAT repeat domain-containing protein [Poritiphilus flavus]|uniref:HEAT repeat-containing protein n=1 Tax=Poritiphilus flavus TaxID=2697053 RepID=A0A6L9EH42_9FLAO|nr:hypothetical protein [Poritiphilus flavus]NAS14074.1 hypothetical protein [Poritiphilus flavus]